MTPIADRKAKPVCPCGIAISDAQSKRHLDGAAHRLAMAEKRAHARGHTYFVRDELALSMMRLGLSAHFTQVRSERHGETLADRHWKTSAEMITALTRFNSRRDDRPEQTLHAALVFASVYGDETPKILIGMIEAEIEAGLITGRGDARVLVATRESDLVALLRTNGVQAPALTLTNLMPHLLAVALAKLEPH